ncbi:MAG: hypothetical protein K6T83_04975 [Alicyclobacillus sp.]|uniref:hypothetical protein n=1 Tax=Alicyclobacillus fructus TaxID=2816082 RepID=UPI001A8C9B1D|nr:hypothetical protein [Alicyclobacillus fructus]MCL6442802.1 hypothetical protein [Alicyclobacillus sp.]
MPEKVRWRGRVIGEIDGNVFLTKRKRATHYVRALHGYAIQTEVFEDLLTRGVRLIRVEETDTNTVWETSIDTFNEHAVRFDYGHGPQLALHERFWTIRPEGQLTLL